MGRSHIIPVQQPDDVTCGPSALKMALEILGKRRSLTLLKERCNTTIHGTSTKDMIRAINSFGLSTMVIEQATLRHVQSALKYSPLQPRALMVSYLYSADDQDNLDFESGHWAVISSFSASKNRIVLLDSYTGKRKSYQWQEFRKRWTGYNLRRRNSHVNGKQFQLIKKKEPQLMLVIAPTPENLPKFTIKTAKTFLPSIKALS